MSGIVCAVRGGPASQRTISKAIDLARQTDLPLYFLYVVNLDFLSLTQTSRVHTISHEMHQMGEFILLMAEQASARQGVEAEGIVRHGSVAAEVIALCHELNVDYLVLGRPRLEREDTVFTQEKLKAFVERTEEQTGAIVVFPEEESSDQP
jgi:nucleotide-binding universal stress UspA family protein